MDCRRRKNPRVLLPRASCALPLISIIFRSVRLTRGKLRSDGNFAGGLPRIPHPTWKIKSREQLREVMDGRGMVPTCNFRRGETPPLRNSLKNNASARLAVALTGRCSMFDYQRLWHVSAFARKRVARRGKSCRARSIRGSRRGCRKTSGRSGSTVINNLSQNPFLSKWKSMSAFGISATYGRDGR